MDRMVGPRRSPDARRFALDLAAAVGAPVLATFVGRWTDSNPTTAGFLSLLAVLLVAAGRGFAAGASASLLATLTYNYFFLPPLHTFTIADRRNWVALASFLVAAVVAGRLLAAARQRAAEADAGRRDAETLSELALQLFAFNARPGDFAGMTSRVLRAVDARGGSLHLPSPEGGDRLGASFETPPGTAPGDAVEVIPLDLGGDHLGQLHLLGARGSERVRVAAGRLLALALERHRLMAETARAEAARESERLQSALLRAVSHDLKSPLTALRLGLESLAGRGDLPHDAGERVATLARDQERLARRIDNLLALARVEAGLVRPRPEPTPPADLFAVARADLAHLLAARQIAVAIAPDCPDVLVDPVLAAEVLVNLLENAARCAPEDRPLELSARLGGGRVELAVADRGPGPPVEAAPEAPGAVGQAGRDGQRGGLGLRIARELARASGGSIELDPRPQGGTVARFVVPAAASAELAP